MRLSTVLLLAACAGSTDRTELTVLAASSLTEAFSDLESAFEAGHPGVEVRISFAGSQTLAAQLRHGAPADVIASASPQQLASLVEGGVVAPPRPIAGNRVVVAVPADAAARAFAELHEVERLVLGDSDAPIGSYTTAALELGALQHGASWRAEVESRVVSREPSVRLVAAKVAMGEADAALVYATDVAALDGLRATPLPFEISPAPLVVQAAVLASPQPELAAEWLALVESAEGQAILRQHGFSAP